MRRFPGTRISDSTTRVRSPVGFENSVGTSDPTTHSANYRDVFTKWYDTRTKSCKFVLAMGAIRPANLHQIRKDFEDDARSTSQEWRSKLLSICAVMTSRSPRTVSTLVIYTL